MYVPRHLVSSLETALDQLVVAEAMKQMAMRGLRRELYHWRSHDQLEVDLLVPVGPRLVPVEIKSFVSATKWP